MFTLVVPRQPAQRRVHRVVNLLVVLVLLGVSAIVFVSALASKLCDVQQHAIHHGFTQLEVLLRQFARGRVGEDEERTEVVPVEHAARSCVRARLLLLRFRRPIVPA